MKLRRFLLISAAATGVVAAFGSSAVAQDAAEAETTIGEIIVTAQKREQSLQDVPVSVTAFTAEMREDAGIITTQDQMNFAPGVMYSATGDRVSVRGIGRTTNQIGTDPGVAVYQDGFYVSSLGSVGNSTLGINRVEVLRGPQGTLYGRNSIGGAVNVLSLRPGGAKSAELRVGFNDYGRVTLEGRVSGPITDFASGSLMVMKADQEDGYFRNISGGPDEGGVVDTLSVDAQVAFEVGSRFDGWLRWNYNAAENRDRTEALISPYDTRYNIGLLPAPLYGADPNSNPGIANPRSFDANLPSSQEIDDNHLLIAELNYAADSFDIKYIGGYTEYALTQSSDGDRSSRTTPFNYPVVFQFDASQIGSPTFNPTTNPAAFDSDLTTPGIQQVTIPVAGESVVSSDETKEAFSHELNVSSTGDGRLQWLAGAYYYQERTTQGFHISLPDDAAMGAPYDAAYLPLLAPLFGFTPTEYAFLVSGAPSTAPVNPSHDAFGYQTSLETRSSAVFAQADFDFSDTLHGTFGIRYTHDEKEGFESQKIVAWYPLGIATGQPIDTNGAGAPGGVIVHGGPPIVVNHAYDISPTARRVSDSWNMVTGTLGLQWTPNDDTMVYGSYSRGAKSGGFNLGTFAAAPVDVETVDAFEIGWKQSFGSRLQVNTSLFHYVYSGMQVPDQVVPAVGVSVPVLINLDEVVSNGLELEAQWLATENLTIRVNYSLLDSEITDGCCFIDAANPFATLYGASANVVSVDPNGNGLQRVTGNRTPLAPEHKFALNATYVFRLSGGDLSVSLTENIRTSSYYTIFNTPDYKIPGSDTTDVTIVWRDRDERYAIVGNVSNLFDEEAVQSFTTTSPQAARLQTVGLQPPRVFRLEFQYRF